MWGGVNSSDSVVTFDSGDSLEPVQATDVPLITSGETHKSLFHKLSTMARNVRYLLKMLGSTDISHLGNGTVTGAISAVAADIPVRYKKVSGTIDSPYSTINAHRVGNLIVVTSMFWHNYTSTNTEFVISGTLDMNSLLNTEETANSISITLQGYTLAGDSSKIDTSVDVETIFLRVAGTNNINIRAASSKAGAYMHRFCELFCAVKV